MRASLYFCRLAVTICVLSLAPGCSHIVQPKDLPVHTLELPCPPDQHVNYKMGTYSVSDGYNLYLQSTGGDDGNLHTSRHEVGDEEMWYLFCKVDDNPQPGTHPITIYALQNVRYSKYIRTIAGTTCPQDNQFLPGDASQYFQILYPTNNDRSLAAVQFRADNRYLFSFEEGDNAPTCHGEVGVTAETPNLGDPN